MNVKQIPTGFHPMRHDRLLQEDVHDTYKTKGKLAEPSVCPDCGAVYHEGHWRWGVAPAGAHEAVCPACHRIRDRYPAGFIWLGGAFFQSHRDEILNLARHEEERARAEHPLKRFMATEEDGDGMLVTTTDIHLARRIGEALHHAYQGELEFHYNPEENLLRVHWTR